MTRILVVDDEPQIVRTLRINQALIRNPGKLIGQRQLLAQPARAQRRRLSREAR